MGHPGPPGPPEDEAVATVASLGDPSRRAIYEYVVAQDRPVSRDESACAVGLSRATAAFHLDRLVRDGLLDAEFRRLGRRQGPGAGRPSKLYRRSDRDIAVSLPPRDYNLAAQLLATAVSEAGTAGEPATAVLLRVARAHGQRAGAGAQTGSLGEALARIGYEPRPEQGRVVLGNCPFHALVEDHHDLVCGMNLALLEGLLEGLGTADWTAAPESGGGRCCVTLVTKED